MRHCRTTDAELQLFANGELGSLDEHLETCEECQAFLADMWTGTLTEDLSIPVIRQLRFDQFIREALTLGFDVVLGMGTAAGTYLLGYDDATQIPTDETEPEQEGS